MKIFVIFILPIILFWSIIFCWIKYIHSHFEVVHDEDENDSDTTDIILALVCLSIFPLLNWGAVFYLLLYTFVKYIEKLFKEM